MANVPARGDRFTPAHPSKNWLEMYTQKADSVQPRAPHTPHTHTRTPHTGLCFGSKSANAIRKQKKRSARSAKEHTYHISAIEVEPKDRRKDEFHVLIDDVLYGPFTKIKYVVFFLFFFFFPLTRSLLACVTVSQDWAGPELQRADGLPQSAGDDLLPPRPLITTRNSNTHGPRLDSLDRAAT